MTIRKRRRFQGSHISTHILTKRMTNVQGYNGKYSSISTHILTKRMTVSHQKLMRYIFISTHILTKRMTGFQTFARLSIAYFNSHPHEEDDESTFTRARFVRHFNSHPHEEDDLQRPFLPLLVCISTHILTKRMTSVSAQVAYFTGISTHILTKRMTRGIWFND